MPFRTSFFSAFRSSKDGLLAKYASQLIKKQRGTEEQTVNEHAAKRERGSANTQGDPVFETDGRPAKSCTKRANGKSRGQGKGNGLMITVGLVSFSAELCSSRIPPRGVPLLPPK